jgi:mRNA interferase RelE/StbE
VYEVTFHEDVNQDLKKLGHSTTTLVLKKIQKIAKNPFIGVALGNRANNTLTGYLKVYVDNKRVRIVYKVEDEKIEVFIIAIGKRDKMKVYKEASNRLENQ